MVPYIGVNTEKNWTLNGRVRSAANQVNNKQCNENRSVNSSNEVIEMTTDSFTTNVSEESTVKTFGRVPGEYHR